MDFTKFLGKMEDGLNKAAENGARMRERIDMEKDRFRSYDDRSLLIAYKEAGGNKIRKAAIRELAQERELI